MYLPGGASTRTPSLTPRRPSTTPHQTCEKKSCAGVTPFCVTCDPAMTRCLECDAGYKLAGSKCVPRSCADIDVNCADCDPLKLNCLKCTSGYKLSPAGPEGNTWRGVHCVKRNCSQDTDPNCAACDPGVLRCTRCKAGFKFGDAGCQPIRSPSGACDSVCWKRAVAGEAEAKRTAEYEYNFCIEQANADRDNCYKQ